MPYRIPLVVAALAAGGALAAQPADAAVVALNGSVFQQATSQVGSRTPVVGRAMNSWDTSFEDLAANASATALGGSDRVFTHGKIAAHWDSADSGNVTVMDHGWDITATDPAIDSVSAVLDSRPDGEADWTYTFTATEKSTFSLDFDLLGVGDTLDLGKWSFGFNDLGGPHATQLTDGFAGGAELTGSLSRALQAGHTYTVSLRNSEGFSATGPLSDSFSSSSAHEHGTFNWAITSGAAVPEPASWAMMIAGFALSGALLRHRRRLSNTAAA